MVEEFILETILGIIFFILISLNIGLTDYILFGMKNKNIKWYNFIPATFLELGCFVVGIFIGSVYF